MKSKYVVVVFRKSFSSGGNIATLLLEREIVENKESLEEAMENWGENSDGGHNNGYRVTCEYVFDNPTTFQLEKFITQKESSLAYLEDRIKALKEEITEIKNIPTKKAYYKYQEIYDKIKNGEKLIKHVDLGPVVGSCHTTTTIYKLGNGIVPEKLVKEMFNRNFLKQTGMEWSKDGKSYEYNITII